MPKRGLELVSSSVLLNLLPRTFLLEKFKINSLNIKYYWTIFILGNKNNKIRSSKISNKILSSSGPNHIFEILLPTSSSSEIDQSDRFFAKANEPLAKLQSLRKLERKNDQKGEITYNFMITK